MSSVKFEELKPRIEEELNKRLALKQAPQDPDGFTLLDGFFTVPYQTLLNANFLINGPTFTQVAIVGNSTGIVHYFALKALLPTETKDL